MEVFHLDKNSSPNSFQHLNYYYIIENSLIRHAALKIQKVWRGFYTRKLNTAFMRIMKYRIHIIREIVKSEESYIKDLDLLLQNCYHPLRRQLTLQDEGSQPILGQIEIETLFANIISIYEFNSNLLSALQQEFSVLKPYSKFSQIMIRFATNFKIYYPYTANCEAANITLEKLRKSNKRFTEFLSQIEYTEKLKDLDLWSFIMKPVQRITKYPLLLTHLLEYTDKSHPDHASVEEALKIYKKINEENNFNIGRHQKTVKLMEYQEIYSSIFRLPIYCSDRTIVLEVYVTTPKNPTSKWKLVIMTDLILIISKGHDQKSGDYYIELDYNSIVKDLKDSKYFSNLFSIIGVNTAETFKAGNKEEKINIINILDEVIASIRRKGIIDGRKSKPNDFHGQQKQEIFEKKQHQRIEVHVVGTEQRFKDGKSQTYYVTVITFGTQWSHKCFKRHSEIRHLAKLLSDIYPKKKLPCYEKEFKFFRTLDTKALEMRKIIIENFLQLILQDEEIRNCHIVHDFLQIPIDFFDNSHLEKATESSKPSPVYNKAITSNLQNGYSCSSSFKNVQAVEKQMRGYSVFNPPIKKFSYTTHSPAPEQNSKHNFPKYQGIEFSPDFDLYSIVKKTPIKEKPNKATRKLSRKVYDVEHFQHSIVVYLTNGLSVECKVDNRTNVRNICKQISDRIGLINHDDFSLFISEGPNKERPLDKDEFIMETTRLQEEKAIGIFKKVSKSVVSIFREHPNQKLVFKKYYFLTKNEEHKFYQIDTVRLDLLVSQSLNDTKELIYDFDHSKALTIMCLGAYKKYYEEILRNGAYEWFKNMNNKKKKFYEFVSDSVLKSKPKEFWESELHNYWDKVVDLIEASLKSGNFLSGQKKHVLDNSLKASHDDDIMSRLTIVNHLIINSMWSIKSYGMNFYKARVYNPNEVTFSRNWPSTKFILGIKHGEILAMTLTKSKCYLSHKLSEIIDIKCYPLAIEIFFSNYEIRLDTKKSFEIKQLISFYKKMKYGLMKTEEQ